MLSNPFRSVVGIFAVMTLAACGVDHQDDRSKGDAPASDELTLNGGAKSVLLPVGPLLIKSVTTTGNGCPNDTVSTNIAPDQQAFTSIFGVFQIAIDPDTKRQRIKLECDVSVALEVPQGWQFAVVSIDQRGFADLPLGARAKLTTTLGFSDKKVGKRIKTKLHGPYSDDFQASKVVRLASSKWSTCGGETSLEIQQDAVVTVKKNQGALISIDSLDGELRQTLGLKWQTCK